MTEATTPTPNPTPLWLIVRLLAYNNENRKSSYVFTIRSATAAILCKRVVLRANMFVTYNSGHTEVMSENKLYLISEILTF
jgi:hypothetical protein